MLKAGKRFAANVSVFPFVTVIEGRKLKVAGIGSVATDPDFRGKGYASRLMKHLDGRLREEGYDLSILWGFRFYRSFGYEMAVPREKFYFSNRHLKPLPVQGKIRAAVPGDWNTMRWMFLKHPYHNERVLKYYGSLERRYQKDTQDPFWVLEKAGRVAAYAVFGRSWGGDWEVMEWGGEPEGAAALIQNALVRGIAKGLTLAAHEGGGLYPWAQENCDSWEQGTDGCMVKIFNLASVLKAFEPQLKRRYEESPFKSRKSFTLRLPDGQEAGIALNGGVRVLPKGSKTGALMELNPLKCVRFLLGRGKASEAAGLKGPEARVLDALFPLKWFWWKSDYI